MDPPAGLVVSSGISSFDSDVLAGNLANSDCVGHPPCTELVSKSASSPQYWKSRSTTHTGDQRSQPVATLIHWNCDLLAGEAGLWKVSLDSRLTHWKFH